MKKLLLLGSIALSAHVFGMSKAFNSLCTSIRYLGASYFPLTATYGHTKRSLTSFDKEKSGTISSFDEVTNTWIESKKSKPKNYQIINIAGKEVPVEKSYIIGPAACKDHTLSYLLGRSKYPYSIITPDIWPIHRLTNNDPNDRGLTVLEYKNHLEEYVTKNTIKNNDGAQQLLAELIKSATKEEIESTFQHEKGHGERIAGLRLASSGPIIATSLIGFDNALMNKIGKNITSLKKPIFRIAAKSSVSVLLGIAYHHASYAFYHAISRHEEYKADDAVLETHIPGHISLSQKAQIVHELTTRELKKNGFKDDSTLLKKIINPTFATHPTDAQRIARSQKRLRKQA